MIERIPQTPSWENEGEKTFTELVLRVKDLGHSEPEGFKRKPKVKGAEQVEFTDSLEFLCPKCNATGRADMRSGADSDRKWSAQGVIFSDECPYKL